MKKWEYQADVEIPGSGNIKQGTPGRRRNTRQAWKQQAVETPGSGNTGQAWKHQKEKGYQEE